MTPAEFKKLIDELISLGEDKNELEFWLKLFPGLEADEQAKIIKNLSAELKQLRQIKK
ncbi:MAG: hypothetical protein Q7K39_04620 [Candidatus Magasanikbacteria bacterium]|nr:hypothetical protein [Candidatus Magasanikbacteria bacterium]